MYLFMSQDDCVRGRSANHPGSGGSGAFYIRRCLCSHERRVYKSVNAVKGRIIHIKQRMTGRTSCRILYSACLDLDNSWQHSWQ